MDGDINNRQANQQDQAQAYGILLIAVAAIGFSPSLAKSLGLHNMGPFAIGFWRNGIGGLLLFSIALFQKKSFILNRYLFKWALIAALFFSLDLSVWHRAVIHAGSGVSTVIGNMQVFVTSVAGYFLFREKLSLRFLLSAIAAVLGVIMLTGMLDQQITFTPLYIRGIVYALATALLYSGYLISIKKAGMKHAKMDVVVFMGWISIISALLMLPGALFQRQYIFWPSEWFSVSRVLILGIFMQAICWWMIASSMIKIPAHRTALILLLQPAIAVVWGFVFFKETLTVLQIIGLLITLGSVYIGSLKSVARRQPAHNVRQR